MAELFGIRTHHQPRSWIERAYDDDDDEIEVAKEQHAALSASGYMFTPSGFVNTAACPHCQDEYIDKEHLDAHLANEHGARDHERESANAKQDRAGSRPDRPISAPRYARHPGVRSGYEPARTGQAPRPRAARRQG